MEQFGLRTRIIMGDGLDSLTAGMKKAFVVTDSFEQGRCGMAGIFRYCR